MAPTQVATIVAGLTHSRLWSIGDGLTSSIPREPGVYAWWEVPGAIPRVPAPPHPVDPFALLYVGIAPRDSVSKALLRSRLWRQHIGGNVAASTFRFGLAALLWKSEGWTPRRSAAGKYRLDSGDNSALSGWQREHLRLAWFVVAEPWLYEDQIVRVMQPPMNRAHNHDHSFYKRMGDAREGFRQAARARSV